MCLRLKDGPGTAVEASARQALPWALLLSPCPDLGGPAWPYPRWVWRCSLRPPASSGKTEDASFMRQHVKPQTPGGTVEGLREPSERALLVKIWPEWTRPCRGSSPSLRGLGSGWRWAGQRLLRVSRSSLQLNLKFL